MLENISPEGVLNCAGVLEESLKQMREIMKSNTTNDATSDEEYNVNEDS